MDMFKMDDLLSRMFKEMSSMEKRADKDVEFFDISPMIRNMNRNLISPDSKSRRSGFSVRITRAGDKPPSVSINTFGNVDKEKMMKQVRDKFGLKPVRRVQNNEEVLKVPEKTEEPKSTIKRLSHKIAVDVELPKVKSERDIQVKELENSVEIRAVAGDQGYFKILTKPNNMRLIGKSFNNGTLILEFS